MANYIPPEQRTLEELQTELDRSFRRWDEINEHGCSDPFWSDGTNMNLVRNHIIYWYKLIHAKQENVQMSLFDTWAEDERPVPPEVPRDYMSPTGRYPDRLKI